MQIQKLTELSGCAAVSEFRWSGDAARRFNLIYGWNRSGKTTLSRTLRLLEKESNTPPGFNQVSARISTTEGDLRVFEGAPAPCDVRVFNEHFQAEYVGFREARAKPIVVLGKRNIELGPQIEAAETQLEEARAQRDEADKALKKLPNLDVILRDVARSVADELSQSVALRPRYDPRRYQAPQVRDLISNGTVSAGVLPSVIMNDQAEVESCREQLRQDASDVKMRVEGLDDLGTALEEANRLLQLVVSVPSIERLDSNADLRRWVQEGFALHRDLDIDACQYCTSVVPESVTTAYRKYFTQAVAEAEQAMVHVRDDIRRIADGASAPLPDSSQLFSDLRDDYSRLIQRLGGAWKDIDSTISTVLQRLEVRAGAFQDEGTRQEAVEIPSEQINIFEESRERIRELVHSHNKRVSEDLSAVEAVAKRLELHLVASGLTERAYFEKAQIEEQEEEELKKRSERVDQLTSKLEGLRAQLADTEAACHQINRLIELFLGEGEIELVPIRAEEVTREYQLLRRGEQTPHLSEGEKSVVALSYFLTKLGEEGGDLSKAVVVLDDPVDSQDANFLFRTFALLRQRLSNAGQVFILTHNFEFFNLVRDWFGYDEVSDTARLFVMRSSPGADGQAQVTHVEDLPRILSDFRTEYQYLMSLLIAFRNGDGNGVIEAPLVPNVARKVLEYFSSFKWSCPSSMSMASVINNHFLPDANARQRGVGESVLKFVNEYSHGGKFDRPITAAHLEAPDVAKMVLDFIELADRDHYRLLKRHVQRRA